MEESSLELEADKQPVFNPAFDIQPNKVMPTQFTAADGQLSTGGSEPILQPEAPKNSETQNWNVDAEHPLPVSEVYSTYGIEYLIMFISLGVSAFALGGLLDSVIDLAMKSSSGVFGSLLNSYAEAALVVSFPIFAFLFLRLESKEESDPSLLTDASRRRGMQITLVISFIVALTGLIGYLSDLLSNDTSVSQAVSSFAADYGTKSSALATFLQAFINLAIAASIFGYYWYKLHKKPNRDLI